MFLCSSEGEEAGSWIPLLLVAGSLPRLPAGQLSRVQGVQGTQAREPTSSQNSAFVWTSHPNSQKPIPLQWKGEKAQGERSGIFHNFAKNSKARKSLAK